MATTTVSLQGPPPVALSRSGKKTAEKRPPDYLFIHTVRFWCMVAIVVIHAVVEVNNDLQPIPPALKSLMLQPFKFGTIGFFIISGFLVGDRLPASDPLSYLRRRANRLLPAWMLWWMVDTLDHTKRTLLHQYRAGAGAAAIFDTLRVAAFWVLTVTSVWFVPNLLIALTCLVMLRKWIDDLRLGAFFLALSLFYSVNIYERWIPTSHTEALFGFVFYLWLGAWCARRKERVLSWLQARSVWWLALWACLAAGASLAETWILLALHNPDDLDNTLRFSNQIFSVLIVILLVRIQRRTWPAFVNVADTTYGIYHSNGILLGFVSFAAARLVLAHGHVLGPAGIVLMWLVIAPVGYGLSLQLTRFIASSPRWAWAVGASNFDLRKLFGSSMKSGESLPRIKDLSNA